MSSLYSEVTAAYSRDRVLGKFDTPSNTLPHTYDELRFPHNEYALNTVYNDVITKLYNNYLYLVANAEMTTTNSPTTAISSVIFNDNLVATIGNINASVTGTTSLSTVSEVEVVKSPNSDQLVIFNYGTDNSYVFKTDADYTTITGLISGNLVEFSKTGNRQFSYSDVVDSKVDGDYLYVLDRGNNIIFKYDITGLLYEDPVIQRTGLNDTEHPGRLLTRTLGSRGTNKNQFKEPNGFSIYDDKVYIIDNGNFSLKIFDTDFNFLQSLTDKDLFDNNPISIAVGKESDISDNVKIFVLTENCKIFTYDSNLQNKEEYFPFGEYSSKFDSRYSEQTNFSEILLSESDDNLLYVSTNKNIIKFYRTNLERPIDFFSLSIDEANLEQIKGFGLDSVSGVDNLSVFTALSSGETKISILKDQNKTTKLYHDVFYTNYFTLSDIKISPFEHVDAITINKTTEKLIYNHESFLENLSKKVYGKYSDTRVPEISVVVGATFETPSSFESSPDFYVGLNESGLTDVYNRPIKKLYQQQEDLFNLLKESYLNTNPPTNVPEVLPSRIAQSESQLISFETDSQSIIAGDSVVYELTRTSTDGEASIQYYTTLGSGTLSSDFSGYVDQSTPETLTFSDGVSSVSGIIFSTADNVFYTGANKTFATILINPVGALLDQNNLTRTTTIQPAVAEYTISLSSGNPTSIEEDGNYNFAAIRTDSSNLFSQSVSCNVFTTNITTTDDDIVPIVSDGTYKGNVETDFLGFVGSQYGQVCAVSAASNGTLVFSPGISAVYFGVSAKPDAISESNETFRVEVSNPSINGSLTNPTFQIITLTEKRTVINLTLDATHPTTVPSTSTISGVNVWSILSADSTFQDVSATYPINAVLTLTDNLTVYSPTTSEGAIYYDTEGVADSVQNSSLLTIVVPDTSYIIGKGGDGGTGLAWDDSSGTDFTIVEDISAYNPTLTGLVDLPNVYGNDGGPAISLSAFDYLTISSQGFIYGGAGGGGAGMLPITASDMPEFSDLSATAGGGGGAGIGTNGFGNGGPIYSGAGSFVNAGSDGTTLGGQGGTIDLTSQGYGATQFLVMSGARGGNIGQSGAGADIPDDFSSYDASFDGVSDFAFRFEGGSVGYILAPNSTTNWTTRSVDILTGTYSGL